MDSKIIEVHDTKLRGMKDSLSISSGGLRGHVEIYEKKNGELHRLQENHNLIVYGGREWLLRRAFGPNMTGEDMDPSSYSKVLTWFGVGTGGGEPGNPLQAGATKGNDKDLIVPTRLRAYNANASFKQRYSRRPPSIPGETADNYFYYKKFSSVVTKEDISSPYLEDETTKYPRIVAEVRIELSSQDASTAGEYTDLNEAALYASSVTSDIADDTPAIEQEKEILIPDAGVDNVQKIEVDANYVRYYLKNTTDDAFSHVRQGDRISVNYSSTDPHQKGYDNIIPENNKCVIIDCEHSTGSVNPFQKITVELPNGKDKSVEDMNNQPMQLKVFRGGYEYFTMFSRVTFSTIRKTTDREIVFLWKIYF